MNVQGLADSSKTDILVSVFETFLKAATFNMILPILSILCLLFPSVQGRCSGIVVPDGYVYNIGYFSTIQFHSPFWDKSGTLPFSLNTPRDSYISQALSNTQLLVAGGQTAHSTAVVSTEILNLHTGTVTQGGDLKTARRRAGHAIHNGVVYTCGGDNADNPALDSCESYSNGEWSELEARMIQARAGPGMVATEDQLIVAGGTAQHEGGGIYLDSAEVYSFESKTFTEIRSMNTVRAYFGMAVLGEWVFACGGWDPTYWLKSCEKYSIGKKAWHQVADLNIERATTNMVVFDGQLFMLGGNTNDYASLKSIEVYNKSRDEWKIQGELMESRSWTSAVAISDC